jgi:hypothetical protein
LALESIKKEIKTKYGKIALSGNSDCCCMPQECCESTNSSNLQSSVAIGYSNTDLDSVDIRGGVSSDCVCAKLSPCEQYQPIFQDILKVLKSLSEILVK